MRGGPIEMTSDGMTTTEVEIGSLLQEVWFAALVGWTGGQRSADDVITHMAMASRRLLQS